MQSVAIAYVHNLAGVRVQSFLSASTINPTTQSIRSTCTVSMSNHFALHPVPRGLTFYEHNSFISPVRPSDPTDTNPNTQTTNEQGMTSVTKPAAVPSSNQSPWVTPIGVDPFRDLSLFVRVKTLGMLTSR